MLGSNINTFTSPQQNSDLADLNYALTGQPSYNYSHGQYSPYSGDSQSSYDNNLPQQSPDPQGMANMNIASPIGMENAEPTIGECLQLSQHNTAIAVSFSSMHETCSPCPAPAGGRAVSERGRPGQAGEAGQQAGLPPGRHAYWPQDYCPA